MCAKPATLRNANPLFAYFSFQLSQTSQATAFVSVAG
jgi:hypothetical protein